MSATFTFTASDQEASYRLDQLLRERFPQFSRARLQEWIRSGAVKVAGQPSRPSHVVRSGEVIEVEPAEPAPLRATPISPRAWWCMPVQGWPAARW